MSTTKTKNKKRFLIFNLKFKFLLDNGIHITGLNILLSLPGLHTSNVDANCSL